MIRITLAKFATVSIFQQFEAAWRTTVWNSSYDGDRFRIPLLHKEGRLVLCAQSGVDVPFGRTVIIVKHDLF